LLKNFFFTFYVLSVNFNFYLMLFIVLFSFFLLFSDLRKKFAWFVCVIILYSIWGFMLDLDGIMLVFLSAEFTIFLLFLMTYLQLYGNYSYITAKVTYWPVVVFPIMSLFMVNNFNNFYFFSSYYKALQHIVSSDFYILYYFLFEKIPVLTIMLTLIISFFSLFFIVMYFSLKLVKNNMHKKSKNLYFLRKQALLKQTVFSTQLYTFQN